MYFPKSQIKTGLVTNGGEYAILETGEPYIGPYWKTSEGKTFSGLSPSATNVQELTEDVSVPPLPLQALLSFEKDAGNLNNTSNVADLPRSEILNKTYANLVGDSTDPFKLPLLPTTANPTPTENDYMVGEFRRYFCKKANELIYLEINKDTYDKLQKQDSTIMWKLYVPFNLSWQLTGPKEQVAETNKNITNLAIQRNNLIKFADFLKFDYLKYYRG